MLSKKMLILSLLSYGAVLAYGRALTGCSDKDIHCNSTAMENIQMFGGMQMKVSTERSSNPVHIFLFPKRGGEEHPMRSRFRRFPKTCHDSIEPLKHTVVTCWAWPNYLTCEFSCIHGYAIREDGNAVWKAARNCREKDNHWKPKPAFPVCEPYIHCETVLIHPGNMRCGEDEGNPWYCDIECITDGEYEVVPMKRYECLDHKYAKSLPHCAIVNTSRVLIQPPKGVIAPSWNLVSKNITEPPTQSMPKQKQ